MGEKGRERKENTRLEREERDGVGRGKELVGRKMTLRDRGGEKGVIRER